MITIKQIQGDGLYSPYAGQYVQTQGVVTGILRKGFYIQTPSTRWDGERSNAIFVFGSANQLSLGNLVLVEGECIDYLTHDLARPITQIKLQEWNVIQAVGPKIEPLVFSSALLPESSVELAVVLNSLEGMLMAIPEQSTLIAGSNSFGDYVCVLSEQRKREDLITTKDGGIIVNTKNKDAWFPGFRVKDYRLAPKLNIGSRLLTPVVGPLHYRVNSWQMAVNHSFDVEDKAIALLKSTIESTSGSVTVLTLNGFNLDCHIESRERVQNPRSDIDDDLGDKRFHGLARAVVEQANTPDIIALQEIQDNDGAEITGNVDATKTYEVLSFLISELSGVKYQWADIPPVAGADGGQPGGNIRNGYLFNPDRVQLIGGSLKLLGIDDPSFLDSRKPLMATFREKGSGHEITLVNVHLVSKREQQSIFAPKDPGVDFREDMRIQQARLIYTETQKLLDEGKKYYITGDFNDHEHSRTLKTLEGESNANLVLTLAPDLRYDYNHRGKLQVLMHGILPNKLVTEGRVSYEIIHGNELVGVEPGAPLNKPSDHAYVLAKIEL